MNAVRILHLEDSPLDAELVERALRRGGIFADIRRVISRGEFLQALGQDHWDLILADYQLPDFDGMSALKHIREHAPELPFVFVSGVLGEAIAIETLKSGATDYVLKRGLERLAPAVLRALQEREEREKRRLAEEALHETEHRFEAMADAAPVLIWMTDSDKRPQFFNRPWLTFTGHTLEEELQGNWTELMHPSDLPRWNVVFDQHFQEQTAFTAEMRVQRGDGEYRWLVINGCPRLSASEQFLGMIVSAIDRTDLKVTEERLRHVAKLESLGILAGGIAHDFNNLLTGIIGHAHLLEDRFTAESEEVGLVTSILQAGNAAAQLTRQMLAYSGRGQFIIEAVNLSELVDDNRSLIEASVPRNVMLDYGLKRPLPLINADRGQIQQVVMNLIINAAEAAEQNSGAVRVRTFTQEVAEIQASSNLTGDALQPGSYVVFEVIDTGHGMDAATQARIFDPFFTTKFTGRGLGLAAVLGIVRGHKGAIQLHSQVGVGSTFTVFFPVAPVQTPSDSGAKLDVGGRSEGTILVVDDSPLVLSAVRLILGRSGFHVITAENGSVGIAKLENPAIKIDLVLLDMIMPVMGGDETLMRIRQVRPHIPVIGISGFGEAEAMQRFGNQLDGFVQKPFIGSHLTEAIKDVMKSVKTLH